MKERRDGEVDKDPEERYIMESEGIWEIEVYRDLVEGEVDKGLVEVAAEVESGEIILISIIERRLKKPSKYRQYPKKIEDASKYYYNI